MQRKGFIRGTCLLLPSSQESGTQARRKTAPRLNPTQPPQVPVPMLCFSTAPTASALSHSPAHTPLPLVVPPEQGLQPWCPSGLRPSRSSLVSQALFSRGKDPSAHKREGAPQPDTTCLTLPLPKLTGQLLPPCNRLKSCALPARIRHVPLL